MARGECILEPGPNSWLNLSASLLSKEGKAIVTSDPDIQRCTIEALQALEPTNMDEYPFYFSDDEKESDIGMLPCPCVSGKIPMQPWRNSWPGILMPETCHMRMWPQY